MKKFNILYINCIIYNSLHDNNITTLQHYNNSLCISILVNANVDIDLNKVLLLFMED